MAPTHLLRRERWLRWGQLWADVIYPPGKQALRYDLERSGSSAAATRFTPTATAPRCSPITSARVRGPALDAHVVEGRAARPDPRLRDWEVPLFERFGRGAHAPPVTQDELVEDGDLLGWERPAQSVAVPGHTVGSVAVFLPEDRVVIAGDAITTMSGEPTLGVFNVDPEQAMDSFHGSPNSTRASSARATAP